MAVDHANHAAAVTAGYKTQATDRGAAFLPAAERWHVRLQKPIVGVVGQSGGEFRADGYGSSQANAEAAAATSLNGQRKVRYGAGTANTGKSHISDGAMTDDLS